MTAFDHTFLFLRNPAGGVEDLDRMRDAGFQGIFCNVGDFTRQQWDVIRSRALSLGMFCGPWMRVDDADHYYPGRTEQLISIADIWLSPVIVNCEKGLDGSGSEATRDIAAQLGSRDGALSTEATPFSSTDWGPVAHYPVLPQLNVESGHTDVNAVAPLWRDWGFRCVFPTFGSYGGRLPTDYRLQAPFNIYTADDCGGDYEAWRPTSSGYQGCSEEEDDVQKIGKDDGIAASFNRLRDLDPGGTLLKKDAKGKWPSLDTLDVPVDQWKAWDKWQRTEQIEKDDHDAQ